MADDEAATAIEPSDEAHAVASGLRSTARWTAAAFAGIPSLAVVGALIRAPGDAGFDEALLIPGVLLVAAGALLGILSFADVLKPTGTSDADVVPNTEVMGLLPEARFQTYAALRQALEETRDDVGRKRVLASDDAGYAEAAEAEAVQAEAAAQALDELLKDKPSPPADLVEEAKQARAGARDLRAAAGMAAASSAIRSEELKLAEQRLASLDGLRRGAYGIETGRTVRERYNAASVYSIFAVGLVAAGVTCLALAPKPKSETTTPELVSLVLEPAGQRALGCDEATVDALRVGGDDETPTIIVLPGSTCPVKTVKFLTKDPDPFGKVKKVEPVEAE
jgi:hypothetical protein